MSPVEVYKFGGASVRDASAIRNVAQILKSNSQRPLAIVVSAMGKTTNALEIVIKNYFDKSNELYASLQDIRKYHNQILMKKD